ncbi:hypothetical protein CFC21_036537, partial [Triticum aestivum]
MSRQNPPS